MQNMDMPMEHVESLLSQVSNIRQLVFTGGEPSLNTKCITETLELCRKHKVDVGFVDITTNGYRVREDFAVACLQWYAYCEDKELCAVSVSNDYWHAVEGRYDTSFLEGLSFFSKRQKDNNASYQENLIIDGNAAENMYDGEPPEDADIEGIEDVEEQDLYLNCNGRIIVGGDWSYRRQEDNVLCHVDKLTETIEKMEQELEYA
jgi:organic radical activating enzyme